MTGGRPHLLVVSGILFVFAAAYVCAFLLRFDLAVPPHYRLFLLGSLPIVVLVKVLGFYVTRVFWIIWAFLGIADVLLIGRAVLLSSFGIAGLSLSGLLGLHVPRSVLVLDPILTFLGTVGALAFLRVARESAGRRGAGALAVEPIFVVGAGDAGETLLRELLRRPRLGVRVVGFLDDNAGLTGRALRGVPVLGPIEQAAELSQIHGVRRAMVAIPSLPPDRLRAIVRLLADADLAIKILPPLDQLVGSELSLQLRDVDIEDLLRRPAVKLDPEPLRAFLTGRTVLVTGAAGSIGSEICRQVLRHRPAALIALDCAESPLHDLVLELLQPGDGPPPRIVPALTDVVDRAALERVFGDFQPEVVFHAAALKHVPVLESHPERAVAVNVAGTRNVVDLAAACAESLVLISTDKAVRPTSVMGATKRVAEMFVQRAQARLPGRRFVSVRFGNVLGSNGSVVPLFKRQIARGGPVTVTHPDMKRYFMTISEATELVLHAGARGRGGEVFVLDMGEPVRIVDLATDLIRLSGLRPGHDVAIEVTGVRPGEKLFEEWAMSPEWVFPTATPRVFGVREAQPIPPAAELEALERAVGRAAIVERLRRLVPDYSTDPRSAPAPGSKVPPSAAAAVP